MNQKQPYLIQSVQRSIDIINCFDEDHPVLSLNQISRRLSLNINTVRGLVNTLVANSLLTHDLNSNTYSLGLYFVIKSNIVYSTGNIGSIISIAHPMLEALSNRFSIFCSLQIINQSHIFMVDSVNPTNAHYKITATLYEPLKLHCTSSGKLLLQYMKEPFRSHIISGLNYTAQTAKTITSPEQLVQILKDQEKRGYSTEFEETALGISSIAAPIFSDQETFFGTLSVTAFSQLLENKIDQIVPELLAAAARIQEGLSAI